MIGWMESAIVDGAAKIMMVAPVFNHENVHEQWSNKAQAWQTLSRMHGVS